MTPSDLDLTYDLRNERLIGNVGDEYFNMHAVSGGGRGSRITPEGDRKAEDYDFRTKEPGDPLPGDLAGGGPLPPGFYRCYYELNHPPFGRCIRLDPVAYVLNLHMNPSGAMKPKWETETGSTRHAFFIHGRGDHGSAGCIVPDLEPERHRLNLAIQANPGTILRAVNPWTSRSVPPNRVRDRYSGPKT